MTSSIRLWANIVKTCGARHSGGQTLVITTLMVSVLLGFVGLATDAGYFFDYRRRMTAAADSAAVAGAMEVKRDPTSTQVVAVARAAAATNGFTHGTDSIAVTVNHPPTSGYNVGNNKFVEVLINRPSPTFFMRVLNITSATVAARAVAGAGSTPGCIYVLDPQADNAFHVVGASVIDAPLCDIFVNSTSRSALLVSGSKACIHAHSINLTGNKSGCSTPAPDTEVPPVADPFSDLQPPTIGSCDYSSQVAVSGRTITLNPGTYCGGIDISGSSTQVTFNPGLYIIKNGFSASDGVTVLGTGVTFYIDSGAVNISRDDRVQLSAPTSGPWEGILFFQNRSNARLAIFSGGNNIMDLEGVLYFPKAPMQYAGGRDTNPDYTVIIVRTLQFTGSTTLKSNFSGLASGDPVKKPMLIE